MIERLRIMIANIIFHIGSEIATFIADDDHFPDEEDDEDSRDYWTTGLG